MWTAFSAAFATILAIPRGRASLSWFLWHGFFLARCLVGAVIAWRREPRDPQSFTESELQRAKQEAGVCPRCDELVLQAEFRCHQCGSMSIQMRGGIDVWMSLVLLVVLVLGILFLFGSAQPGRGTR